MDKSLINGSVVTVKEDGRIQMEEDFGEDEEEDGDGSVMTIEEIQDEFYKH